jgi:glutathione S-transferase
MKFEIDFERTYPQPIAKVWNAATNREALGQWLMENNFEAEPGASFKMWCEDGEGGTDTFLCEVLEFEPPTRMVWSWVLEGREADGATRVEFHLEESDGGTRLTIRHSGDRDPETIEKFKGGWPVKLEQLEEALRDGLR